MTLSHHYDPVAQDSWVQECEACLRAADFEALRTLLEQQAASDHVAEAMFYHGRVAVGTANFEEATRLFWRAVREATSVGHTVFQQRSLIWEAFAESQCGNYKRAQELVSQLETTASHDHPIYADIFFVRGMIASEQDTLPLAQHWLEAALNVAINTRDLWMEARCCANLAAIYDSQGLLDRAAWMIRRVERINASPNYPSNHLQLIQVRNIHMYNLRFRGELSRALRLAEPLPASESEGTRLFAGYLTLTTAMVATDIGDFSRAEQLWDRAYRLLHVVADDQRTMAELLWERAWLHLRQGKIEMAHQDIQEALYLINDKMETECYHAYVIAALVAIRRGDLGTIGLILRQASERFSRVGHRVGLASVLLHIGAYYLRDQRIEPGRVALAEALTIMWTHQLYGGYYWDPETMVFLCREAMKGDIWGDDSIGLAGQVFGLPEAEVAKKFELEGGPANMWGEFATSLAMRRLAEQHWQQFVPLLSDPRAKVRRRAAQVLSVIDDRRAYEVLEQFQISVDSTLSPHSGRDNAATAPLQVYSFGQFELLLDGRPLHLPRASTRKALIIFAALLLAGSEGMQSQDLALILWPDKPEQARSKILYMTISNLRTALSNVLGDDRKKEIITWADDRYYLKLKERDIWWDWIEVRRIALEKNMSACQNLQVVDNVSNKPFMPILSELIPPAGLDRAIEVRWDLVVRSFQERIVDLEEQTIAWLEEIREEMA